MTPLRSTNGSTHCRRPRAGLDCRADRQHPDHAAFLRKQSRDGDRQPVERQICRQQCDSLFSGSPAVRCEVEPTAPRAWIARQVFPLFRLLLFLTLTPFSPLLVLSPARLFFPCCSPSACWSSRSWVLSPSVRFGLASRLGLTGGLAMDRGLGLAADRGDSDGTGVTEGTSATRLGIGAGIVVVLGTGEAATGAGRRPRMGAVERPESGPMNSTPARTP